MSTLFDVFPQELKEKVVEARIAQMRAKKSESKKDADKTDFAFPKVKKLPLETHRNVQSAITHFFNVKGVSKEDRAEAYKKILAKAEYFEICTMGFKKEYEQYFSNCSQES